MLKILFYRGKHDKGEIWQRVLRYINSFNENLCFVQYPVNFKILKTKLKFRLLIKLIISNPLKGSTLPLPIDPFLFFLFHSLTLLVLRLAPGSLGTISACFSSRLGYQVALKENLRSPLKKFHPKLADVFRYLITHSQCLNSFSISKNLFNINLINIFLILKIVFINHYLIFYSLIIYYLKLRMIINNILLKYYQIRIENKVGEKLPQLSTWK